jgi:hypothetical protein
MACSSRFMPPDPANASGPGAVRAASSCSKVHHRFQRQLSLAMTLRNIQKLFLRRVDAPADHPGTLPPLLATRLEKPCQIRSPVISIRIVAHPRATLPSTSTTRDLHFFTRPRLFSQRRERLRPQCSERLQLPLVRGWKVPRLPYHRNREMRQR